MRSRLARIMALTLILATASPIAALAETRSGGARFEEKIAALEAENGGRLGVAALNTVDGERLGYRADERFAMTSTFKWILVAAVLSRVDAGDETLDRKIKYGEEDIQDYAPIAREHLDEGQMTIADLSDATIRYSDNTTANLLLESIGGPAELTRYIRTLGDTVTRLDRYEPFLNSNIAGDERDTTTPAAMVNTLSKVLVGDALSPDSQARLLDWLIHNTTGDTKLRAGLDPEWTVGDKTGAGERGATNDVAIVWPGEKPPFLIAVYYSGSTLAPGKRNAVIAEVGRIVGSAFY